MGDVTLVTARAAQDALSEVDYRDIYEELRALDAETGVYAVALDRFVVLVGSRFSKASWSKYHRGEMVLNRTMRNELRRAVGLDELPMTVEEAVAAGADPDAEVWRVGGAGATRVVLVAATEPVGLYLNGTVQLLRGEAVATTTVDHVTAVTARRRGRRYWRPALPEEWLARALAAGVDVRAVIEAALRQAEGEVCDGD